MLPIVCFQRSRASMYKGTLTHNLLCSEFVELTLISQESCSQAALFPSFLFRKSLQKGLYRHDFFSRKERQMLFLKKRKKKRSPHRERRYWFSKKPLERRESFLLGMNLQVLHYQTVAKLHSKAKKMHAKS